MTAKLLRSFICIGAMDKERGLGKDGGVPWNLPKQYNTYFEERSLKVIHRNKKNALIMGRLTYFSFPDHIRPLYNRLNVVISKSLSSDDLPADVLLFKCFTDAIEVLSEKALSDEIENIYVCGGHGIYEEALQSSLCQGIYLTEIQGKFGCDVYFPEFDQTKYQDTHVPDLCAGEEEENGVKYELHVYLSDK